MRFEITLKITAINFEVTGETAGIGFEITGKTTGMSVSNQIIYQNWSIEDSNK